MTTELQKSAILLTMICEIDSNDLSLLPTLIPRALHNKPTNISQKFYIILQHLFGCVILCMMAAMVQSFPQPTSTMTMLQTRSPSSETFQTRSQGQQHQQNPQMPRNIYNTSVGGMTAGNYRGQTSTSPVAPYAFQTTTLQQSGPNPLRQHPTAPPNPRLENRTASAPSVPLSLQASQHSSSTANRPRPPPVLNFNTSSTQPQISKDDPSALSTINLKQPNLRPLSTLDLNPPSLHPASYANVAKSSPDRYRRNHRRAETSGALPLNGSTPSGSAMPSGSGMATVGHLYSHPMQTSSTPSLSTYRGTQAPPSPVHNDFNVVPQPRLASKDDSNLQRERQASADLAKRYRRRSISSLEAKDFASSEAPAQQPAPQKTYAAMLAGPAPAQQPALQERKEVRIAPASERPLSAHGRNGSNESSNSGRSAPKPSSVSQALPAASDSNLLLHIGLYVILKALSHSKTDTFSAVKAFRILPTHAKHCSGSYASRQERSKSGQHSCTGVVGGEQETSKPVATI